MTTNSILTIQNILFVIFLIGTIIGVYNHFKKPQDESKLSAIIAEKEGKMNDAIAEKEVGTKATILAQKESEGKALLLALQVQTEKEFNTKKFTELADRFNSTDEKIENLTISINNMNLSLSKELMKVGTILDEHIKVK